MTLHATIASQPCTHEPKDLIAAFTHTCKHCGKDIEPQHCAKCDGTGSIRDRDGGLYECRRCGGTGVKRLEEAGLELCKRHLLVVVTHPQAQAHVAEYEKAIQ